MNYIVECIPNFSEAKVPEVMDHIANEIKKIKGINLANRHSDVDHNRTVLTLIGNPEPIAEAAFQCGKLAKELINLDHHTGQHPRIGALDVLPFVPLSGTPMQICIDLAHQVGGRIGDELHIPVYFYGEAAYTPDRQALENIRRGEYEGLKQSIHSDPQKAPDAGPIALGPAGAVAVGARYPLIAFNVLLETDDIGIAREIAQKIRFSSGGFQGVKALGLSVGGKAQVSMNLTNFKVTGLPVVLEAIKLEANKFHIKIAHTELVGLLPQEAAMAALAHYLQLPDFNAEMLIETHIL